MGSNLIKLGFNILPLYFLNQKSVYATLKVIIYSSIFSEVTNALSDDTQSQTAPMCVTPRRLHKTYRRLYRVGKSFIERHPIYVNELF